jgi:hypothetical protein
MARRHTPLEQLRQAKQMARDHNLIISERSDQHYRLFRNTGGKPAYLGQCTGPENLFKLVSRFA